MSTATPEPDIAAPDPQAASETPPPPQPAAAIDVEQIIRDLDAAYDRLPEPALRACQANREVVIPRLIQVLEEAVRFGQMGAVRRGNAPLYALFLLAEFGTLEAFAVFWQFLKLPHDIPDDLMGESVHEDLPRMLVTFAGDRPDLLDELIRDDEVSFHVRWAAVDAFAYLVRDGLLSRRDAIARLTSHLTEAIDGEDVQFTGPVIIELLKLNANEARPVIERAFEENMVEEFLVDSSSVDDELRPDDPESCNNVECHTPTKITDTVEEMRAWYAPLEGKERQSHRPREDSWTSDDAISRSVLRLPDADDKFPTRSELATIRHEASRVGRNDPCPCGSGKKYKKCCMRL